MKLLLRTLLWATLFAVPCLWLSGPWQFLLARMTEWVLALFRQSVSMDEVQVMSPFDIGLFAALCLASSAATWRERRRAILVGIPILVAVEVGVLALSTVPALLSRGAAADPDSGPARFGSYTIESIPWVSALVVWMALLGSRSLQPLLEAATRPTAARAGADRPAGRAPRG